MHLLKIEGQTHSAQIGQPRGHPNHYCERTLLLEGAGGSGSHPSSRTHAAGPLLCRCLHVLLRLTLGYEDRVEYVRTIVVARLLWSQWFARLPGVAHSEELFEALLSRVVHLMAQHPGNCTLQQVHDLFILTPVAGQTTKDLQYVNVPKGLPQLFHRRFTRLMARFDVGVIPHLVWSSQK